MLHKALTHAAVTFCHLSQDSICFFCILLKSRSALASEHRFLRRQLALYQQHQHPPAADGLRARHGCFQLDREAETMTIPAGVCWPSPMIGSLDFGAFSQGPRSRRFYACRADL